MSSIGIASRADYEEIRLLGQGSFNTVHLARKRGTDTLIAVRRYSTRRIKEEFNQDSKTASFVLKRVRAQAGLMLSLHHQTIVRTLGSFEEIISGDESIHILFEYCNSGDMEAAIQENKRFSEAQICSWAKQIVLALQFLHSHGMAHRDVKTQNIFLMAERRFVKLGELGCFESLNQVGKEDRARLLPYCAPEVLLQNKFSRKSDVWMLGCVVYRLATLKFPFFEQQTWNFKDHVVNGIPLPISKNYSSELREFVRSTLKKNPLERPTITHLLGNCPFLNRPVATEACLDLGLERINCSDIPQQYKAALCSAMQAHMISADMLAVMPDEQLKIVFPEMGLRIAINSWREEDAATSKPARLLKAAETGDVEFLRRILTVFGAKKLLKEEEAWAEFDGDTPLIRAAKFGQLEVIELLLLDDVNCPISGRNSSRNMAIHEAINSNHVRIVEALLMADPRLLEATGEYGWTPLMRAAAFGQLDCVQLLLKKCANPTAVGDQGCEDTAVHLAAYFGRGEVVQYMLNVLPNLIDKRNIAGATPLFRAAAGGHSDIVNLIVSLGANVDPVTVISPSGKGESFCFTPLHEAAAYGHLDVVKLLVKYGADINRRSKAVSQKGLSNSKKAGSLPIHFAAEHGHIEVVQYILSLNVQQLEGKNTRGCSCLSLAAAGGHVRLVKHLLERRADTESTDNLSRTPLIHAATKGHLEVVKILLKGGANIYAKSTKSVGQSQISEGTPTVDGRQIQKVSMAIHHAAENGHLSVVKYLLEANDGLLEIKDSLGQSPLACAISSDSRSVEIARLLLSKKANTETRDNKGWTPLHRAASVGNVALVELFMNNRANVYALTNNGDMAIHLAVMSNHVNVVKIFLEERPDLMGARNKRQNTPYKQALMDKSNRSEVVRFLKNWDASFCSN